MQKAKDQESQMNNNIIGVYPIPFLWLQANDGGSAQLTDTIIKHIYNHQYGYFTPGGIYLQVRAFSGGHRITLGNFELKKGFIYTLSAYIRTKQNLQLINPAISGVAQIICNKLTNNFTEVSNSSQMSISTSEYLPNFKKLISKPYIPQEDEVVAINLYPYLQNHNEFTFDILCPEIQWRK